MAIQTATTGNLENAQNIIIAEARYTAEASTPCKNLIEQFRLGQGQKQITVPKVGQMSLGDLVDGIDITESQDISMTTTDLTTGEKGGMVIITDKLARQENEDVFKMVGRQLGDASDRKVDEDIIALFSALNGGTTLGAASRYLVRENAAGCVAFAKARNWHSPISAVHHPNAVFYLTSSLAGIQATYNAGILQGLSERLLANFWKCTVSGVNWFEDGNIDTISGATSGYGAIFAKDAMCYIESKAWKTEQQRDASARATELVIVADYGVFELDDSYGAPLRYEIGAVATTSTSTGA